MKKLETKCARVKIKDGCLDKAYEWAKELNNRSEEVYQTLRDENVYIESVFLEKTSEGNFLIYFMKVKRMIVHKYVSIFIFCCSILD